MENLISRNWQSASALLTSWAVVGVTITRGVSWQFVDLMVLVVRCVDVDNWEVLPGCLAEFDVPGIRLYCDILTKNHWEKRLGCT